MAEIISQGSRGKNGGGGMNGEHGTCEVGVADIFALEEKMGGLPLLFYPKAKPLDSTIHYIRSQRQRSRFLAWLHQHGVVARGCARSCAFFFAESRRGDLLGSKKGFNASIPARPPSAGNIQSRPRPTSAPPSRPRPNNLVNSGGSREEIMQRVEQKRRITQAPFWGRESVALQASPGRSVRAGDRREMVPMLPPLPAGHAGLLVRERLRPGLQ